MTTISWIGASGLFSVDRTAAESTRGADRAEQVLRVALVRARSMQYRRPASRLGAVPFGTDPETGSTSRRCGKASTGVETE